MDLGLETLWATCNVGATSIEGFGDYFAWGETSPKEDYSTATLKYYDNDAMTVTKYNTDDNNRILDLEDDAANANWGGNWRTPTKDEWIELIENCDWEWVDLPYLFIFLLMKRLVFLGRLWKGISIFAVDLI